MDHTHATEGAAGGPEATNALAAVLRLLAVLRRRWLIIAVTVASTFALSILALSQMRPYWMAQATMIIHATGPQILDTVRNVNEEDLWNPTTFAEYTGTQKRIIQSRAVSELALKELGISADPVFLGVDEIDDPEARSAAAQAIDPVERLQSMIRVGDVPESRVVWIGIEYPDPDAAAEISNAVARAYLRRVTSTRADTGVEAKSRVKDEREGRRQELAEKEKVLDEFKQEHEITSISLSDRQNLISQNISTLTTKAKEAEALRIQLDALYEEAKRLTKTGSIASASLLPQEERMSFDDLLSERMEAEREFERIKTRYLPRMPEYQRANQRLALVERRVEEGLADLLASLDARRKAARTTESKLRLAVEMENKRALELGRLEPQYRELEREASVAADAYALVSKRDAEIDMTNRVETNPPVEILDEAVVPVAPTRPRKPLYLAAALLVGLTVGATFAFVADLRDERIRSASDLSRAIGSFDLPTLGQLPVLAADPTVGAGNIKEQRRLRDLYTHLHPQSKMAERCRGIRTSLGFSLSTDRSVVILVTSPGSGEGKSSTASNLAISFCQAGKRTVLVDADMRRPRLHQLFPPAVDELDASIVEVLQEKRSVGTAVRGNLEGAPELLHVLTCHTQPDHPAEMLGSPQARRMVAELREQFDVVIIDSPPALPVTDPIILAPLADGVVVVARCLSTTRSHLQHAISLLRQSDTNILGLVLNHVDARTERYGYGYGYGYTSEYYNYKPRQESA